MRLDEPPWWYSQKPQIAARLLQPLGYLYGRVARWRYQNATPFRASLPVICIGNFTAGGTGKTPAAITIAELLTSMGEQPAFLSRGYGGRLRGPHWVNAAIDSNVDVGDEPLLLARHAPTLIARERPKGALAIAANANKQDQPNPTVIIMDDGLQNPSLAKDLTIAIVDGARGFGNGAVIPAGPLRAPLSFQLPLADAILINNRDAASNRNGDGGAAKWLSDHFEGPVLNAETRPKGETDWLKNSPVLAFAGIGAPERFFSLLERLGAKIIERRAFPDHHAFSDADVDSLLAAAANGSAQLITTEKDLARLSGDEGSLSALKSAVRTLPIMLHLEESEAQQLKTLLQQMLQKHSAN